MARAKKIPSATRREVPQGCDFPAAILKGVLEHNDGTSYFGSLGGYLHYKDVAIERGWVVEGDVSKMLDGSMHILKDLIVTDKGREVYQSSGLASLPNVMFSRAYMWDWSAVKFSVEEGSK